MAALLDTLRSDANDTLRIYNEGQSIVKKVGKFSPVCQAIGDNKPITVGRRLGGGLFGSVFDVLFKGDSSGKTYVVKKIDAEIVETTYHGDTSTLEKIADKYYPTISKDVLVDLNGGNPSKIIKRDGTFNLPVYVRDCFTTSPQTFPDTAAPAVRTITIPPGSYLCDNSVYTELINGLLASQLASNEICPNYGSIVDMIMCRQNASVEQFIFMEKLDNDFNEEFSANRPMYDRHSEFYDSYLVQLAVAFAVLQREYKMVHNDAHFGNIMAAKPPSVWRGQDLSSADYFHYNVSGTDFYVPATPIIPKLVDWGKACKYSPPMVLEKGVITGWSNPDPWVPNAYSTSYDLFFVAINFYADGLLTPEFRECLAWMINGTVLDLDASMALYYNPEPTSYRPLIEMLPTFTPQQFLLEAPGLLKYTLIPESGNIVTIAEI